MVVRMHHKASCVSCAPNEGSTQIGHPLFVHLSPFAVRSTPKSIRRWPRSTGTDPQTVAAFAFALFVCRLFVCYYMVLVHFRYDFVAEVPASHTPPHPNNNKIIFAFVGSVRCAWLGSAANPDSSSEMRIANLVTTVGSSV